MLCVIMRTTALSVSLSILHELEKESNGWMGRVVHSAIFRFWAFGGVCSEWRVVYLLVDM